MGAIHRGDVAAVSKLLAKSFSSKSSMLIVKLSMSFTVLLPPVLCIIKPCWSHNFFHFLFVCSFIHTYSWSSWLSFDFTYAFFSQTLSFQTSWDFSFFLFDVILVSFFEHFCAPLAFIVIFTQLKICRVDFLLDFIKILQLSSTCTAIVISS